MNDERYPRKYLYLEGRDLKLLEHAIDALEAYGYEKLGYMEAESFELHFNRRRQAMFYSGKNSGISRRGFWKTIFGSIMCD